MVRKNAEIQDPQPMAVLSNADLLDAPARAAFDNLVTLACDLLNMEFGAIHLIGETGFEPLAYRGELQSQPSPEHSICHRTLEESTLVCVENSSDHPLLSAHPMRISGQVVQAYIGVALRTASNRVAGMLCLYGTEPRHFSATDLQRFESLALQATQLLLLSSGQKSMRASREQLLDEQSQLNRELARNEVLLHNAAAGIIRIDSRGTIDTINPMVEKIFGYTAGELIGQNISILMNPSEAHHHDEYLAHYQRGKTQAESNLSSVIGAGRELKARHKQGHSIAIHLAVSEVKLDENAPTEFIGIITDLSDVKGFQSELERQKALLTTLHEGLTNYESLISGEQIWAFLHQSLLDIAGADYALIGEVVDHEGETALKVRAITDLSWDAQSQALMRELVAGDNLITNTQSLLGKVFYSGEVVLTQSPTTEPGRRGLPEGHPPLHNYAGIPVKNSGETIGMIAIANTENPIDERFVEFIEPFVSTCALLIQLYRQMDERERFLIEVQEARDQMAAANNAKTEFLSSMSHELRTPLNSIIGFSQLLLNNRRQPLPERQQKQVTQIHNSGKHLLTLINEILDLAKIEAGKLTISIEPTAILSVVEESVDTVAPLAERAGIEIRINPPSEQIDVLADYTRFKQVLINLLSNAIKYNRHEGWVRIHWRVDGELAKISVTDSGIGIAENHMESLFEPFNRLGAESSSIEGTGVGLALTRKLIEYMNGAIEVESSDSGSTFTVHLPIAQVHTEPSAQKMLQDTQAEQHSEDPDLPRRRVLYIEDNPANQRLMEDIFEELEGLELICAHDPRLGLDLAMTKRPELIICDIHLPGMDGFQLLHILKENSQTRDIPVIALSANAMPSDVKRGLREGFLHYLTKPVDIPNLLQVIDALMNED